MRQHIFSERAKICGQRDDGLTISANATYCHGMTTRDKLIDEIDAFIARTGVKEYKIGAAVIGDPSFVLRLRRGRDPKA